MFSRTIIYGAALIGMAGLNACKTADTQNPTPSASENIDKSPSVAGPENISENSGQTASDPQILAPESRAINDYDIAPRDDQITPTPENPIIYPPSDIVTIGSNNIRFSDYLPGWQTTDLKPALTAFSKNCSEWESRDAQTALMVTKPEFGQYQNWQPICQVIPSAPYDDSLARWFFETYFLPANLVTSDRLEGLLTGYYEPEIEVRTQIDGEFFEPILAYPDNSALQNQKRDDIYRSQVDYKVLAYGRPIDVFFMQIQGSGRIRFEDGRIQRAAYNGNNGHKYKSIGSVLIQRGEMTREQASKQAIEDWMNKAGSTAARALMNENPRYIYFTLEDIQPDEGPKGSFRVPLTAMGSMAIDPKSRPYGVPVWLETILPQFSGDYRGTPQNILVIAQDTGSAIRGEARGDLFFGSGDLAGELAGVMKHDVTMTHLLPRNLVLSQLGLR